MISVLVALEIVDGASDTSAATTLTAQDLVNLKNAVWEYDIEYGAEAQQVMRLLAAVIGGWVGEVGNMTPRFSSPWNEDKIRLKYSTNDVGERIRQITIDLD